MTGAEIALLSKGRGLAIGAHTTHHVSLPAHPLALQRGEMVESKLALERILGGPVLTFSYPFGDHDAGTAEVVRAARFIAGVTVRP